MHEPSYLPGLKRELEYYERTGNEARAAQVRDEIARVAGDVETTAEPAPTEAAVPPQPPTRSKTKKGGGR